MVGDVDQIEACVLMSEVGQVEGAIPRLQWLAVVFSEQGEGGWRKAVESCACDGHIIATDQFCRWEDSHLCTTGRAWKSTAGILITWERNEKSANLLIKPLVDIYHKTLKI